MTNFEWKFQQIYTVDGQLSHVDYLLTATDGDYSVSTAGTHQFSEGTVNKPFAEIVEGNIRDWIEKDTTQDDINPLKLNLENQLNSLKNAPKKSDFPWLADTFVPGA